MEQNFFLNKFFARYFQINFSFMKISTFLFLFLSLFLHYLYPRLRVNRDVSGIFGLRNFSETD